LLNKKDYPAAGKALLAWVRGNGKVLSGLVKRRKAEKALFDDDNIG
jgi:GH24 family phage-related lysozyme (muramidase)